MIIIDARLTTACIFSGALHDLTRLHPKQGTSLLR
jgi:hypothetical protein